MIRATTLWVMLLIGKGSGRRKTLVFCTIIMVISTCIGMICGSIG